MGIFSSINIAASGLTAQRLRQDVIGNNLANVNSTRTPEGGPFKRSRVIFTAQTEDPYWKGPFTPRSMDNGGGRGVKASSVEKDTDTPGRLVYDPTHPDAIKSGKRAGYVGDEVAYLPPLILLILKPISEFTIIPLQNYYNLLTSYLQCHLKHSLCGIQYLYVCLVCSFC
jgi:flagellar basal-body rod protein FlgC